MLLWEVFGLRLDSGWVLDLGLGSWVLEFRFGLRTAEGTLGRHGRETGDPFLRFRAQALQTTRDHNIVRHGNTRPPAWSLMFGGTLCDDLASVLVPS